MARPLIGVCAAVERAHFGAWKDEPAVLLPLSYARAIHGAGGMVAMLPPDRRATGDPSDLLDRMGHQRHRPVPGSWAEHDVRLEPGSLAAEAAGTERLTVKSHHHQGVDRVAEGLSPSAWAAD